MSLIERLRARVEFADTFPPAWVDEAPTPDEVALLLDIAEAAQQLRLTWLAHGYTHNHIPDALTLSEAVARLDAAES